MDKIERLILLQKMRQFLMYVKFEALGLRNLQPLRGEVECEYQKIIASDDVVPRHPP